MDNQSIHYELGVAIDNFISQVRSGSQPDIEQYASEHPELKADLLELLPMMLTLGEGDKETKNSGSKKTIPIPDALVSGIDDYELENELGRGGMGVVYVARQKSLDRKVAIKFLSQSASSKSTFATRFLVEAKRLHLSSIRISFLSTKSGTPIEVTSIR